jgi:Protein of unknown function (DUF3147)
MMRMRINPAALGETRWYEYAVRILFGGAITVGTGLVAKKFGPGIGGLFLAFPAIFPASITLIEKHQKAKRQKVGLDGTIRGREAASLDARGTALGTLALMVFAAIVWRLLPSRSPLLVLPVATVVWFAVALLIWRFRKIGRGRPGRGKLSGKGA